MATIKEDYVSFEIAKLLKEKGFDARCPMIYTADGEMLYTDVKHHNMYAVTNKQLEYYTDIIAPTLQMAMKWLREVHNIGIFPSTYTHIVDRKTIHSYGTAIINLKTYELMTDNYLSNDTYEDAVETAIKYCLENLI